MLRRFSKNIALLLLATALPAAAAAKGAASKSSTGSPPWVANLPIPQNEKILLVVKGIFATRGEAERRQAFIQQLMVRYPGDGVDSTDRYQGLPPGKFVVGTLFDGRERAKWWIDYSYRNRSIPKGDVQEVTVKGESALPYFPDPARAREKRLIAASEALQKARELPDIKLLSASKTLKYKITDWPRNGDLRYEVEILEDRGRKDPVMVDFVMVSALDGAITERYAQSLGRQNFGK